MAHHCDYYYGYNIYRISLVEVEAGLVYPFADVCQYGDPDILVQQSCRHHDQMYWLTVTWHYCLQLSCGIQTEETNFECMYIKICQIIFSIYCTINL